MCVCLFVIHYTNCLASGLTLEWPHILDIHLSIQDSYFATMNF